MHAAQPYGTYERRRRRTTIALIESDWLDVKMWTLSLCLSFKLRRSRRSRSGGNENNVCGLVWWSSALLVCFGEGGGRVELTTKKEREGRVVEMGLSGRLGRRFGQDAVREGERHTHTLGAGWVWFGLGRWVFCCVALCCCRKWWGQRRGWAGRRARRNGEGEKETSEDGWLAGWLWMRGDRKDGDGVRGRERDEGDRGRQRDKEKKRLTD